MNEDHQSHKCVAVIVGNDTSGYRILNSDEAERKFNPKRDQVRTVYEELEELEELIGKIADAFCWFSNRTDDFEKEIKEFIKNLDFETKKWGPPPRSTVSRARSPAVRRWWINYKARDKLPCISLKSGGKRKCQRKRSAYRTQCLP